MGSQYPPAGQEMEEHDLQPRYKEKAGTSAVGGEVRRLKARLCQGSSTDAGLSGHHNRKG